MAEQQKCAPKGAPRMRLSQEQRDRFIELLGETGNRRTAAEAIGVEPRNMDQRRRFDRLLDRQWREALERAERRLAGAAGPLDTGSEFNVIRKSRDGRTQIVAAGPKRWSKKVETRFMGALAMCGNIAAAARSVGFTESCIWQRRRKYAAFAQALEEALEDAEMRIEFRMATRGSEIAVADLEEKEAGGDGAGGDTPRGELSPGLGADRFDPDTAMRFLKWREEKRRGHGRRGRLPEPESIEEVRASILRKVAAIERHQTPQRLAQGWQRDEQGNWIPPGWVRAAPSGESGQGSG